MPVTANYFAKRFHFIFGNGFREVGPSCKRDPAYILSFVLSFVLFFVLSFILCSRKRLSNQQRSTVGPEFQKVKSATSHLTMRLFGLCSHLSFGLLVCVLIDCLFLSRSLPPSARSGVWCRRSFYHAQKKSLAKVVGHRKKKSSADQHPASCGVLGRFCGNS